MTTAIERARNEVAHQERLFLDWGKFWRGEWGPIRPEGHKFFLGTGKAIYDQCCGRSLVDFSLAPFPETSLVGPYLKICAAGLEERPHVDHPELLGKRPPIYFNAPQWSDTLIYVDVVHAYWSIYTRTTLDVDYDGEHPPIRGQVEFLDPEGIGEYKIARNALIGMMRRTRRRGIDHGTHFAEIVPAHRRRPDLWGLVMDCLTLIAASARDLGCVYYHTDGAIFTSLGAAEAWMGLLAECFGVTATIRAAGPGSILGLSRFTIGEVSAGRSGIGDPVDSMVPLSPSLISDLSAWLIGTSILA